MLYRQDTLKAKAARLNISYSTVQHRIARGWSRDDALYLPLQRSGRRPNSMRKKAEDAGIPWGTVRYRMNVKHMTLEEAIKPRLVVAKVAREHGMIPSTLARRLKSGLPLKMALKCKLQGK